MGPPYNIYRLRSLMFYKLASLYRAIDLLHTIEVNTRCKISHIDTSILCLQHNATIDIVDLYHGYILIAIDIEIVNARIGIYHTLIDHILYGLNIGR